MKKNVYMYKNCPYEDYGFSSCRVCPNFQKCSKRKGEQIKKRKENEFKELILKLEVVLVCLLVLSMVIGMFAGFTSLAKELPEPEVTQIEEPAEGVVRPPMTTPITSEQEVRNEIVPVITPIITVSAAEFEEEPEFFEGFKVVDTEKANHFGPSRKWLYILSEKDMRYIAKVVWAEARGECLEGQIAVAAVILNRYYSGKTEFNTDSIYDVVTQHGAFASIRGVTDSDLAEYPDCMRAVRLACRGWDPTRETFENGALYFFNPDGVHGYQARIRTNIIVHTIGGHDFHVDFNLDEVRP